MDRVTRLRYVIDHVFLPAKLPQTGDDDTDASSSLIQAFKASLAKFRPYSGELHRPNIDCCISMLQKLAECIDITDNTILAKYIERLATDDCLALHIKAQNAAFLVRRSKDSFQFMSFELAASSQAVIECRGRLQRFFPGPVIEVPQQRVLEKNFLEELTRALQQLNEQQLSEAIPQTQKAGVCVEEIRDTVHPMFVTGMVMAILRGIGEIAEVSRLQKNIREDVLWDNGLLPWRRSPLWLLMRVSAQLCLHEAYKPCMIYFMSCVLQRAIENQLESELVYMMCAKIVHRIKKLEPSKGTLWLTPVQESLQTASNLLRSRWNALQHGPEPLVIKHQPLFEAGPVADSLLLKVPGLRQYLQKREFRSTPTQQAITLPLSKHLRIDRYQPDLPCEPQNSGDVNVEKLWLVDMECWVENSLETWKERLFHKHPNHIDLSEPVFARFAKVITTYKRLAEDTYSNSPEEYSIATLTLMEMWRTLDEMVLSSCPLLGDYEPGFQPALFESLLLKSHEQLERLGRVEEYLMKRQTRACYKDLHIFTSAKEESSFSVRFYNDSSSHQTLRQTIEDHAGSERTNKQMELSRLKKEYESLIHRADQLSCEWTTVRRYGWTSTEHSSICSPCALRKKAKGMQITVYEWPLPRPSSELKAVVFELNMPSGFSEWRDLTLSLLIDTLSTGNTRKREGDRTYGLQHVDSLKHFLRPTGRRFQLKSITKPFCMTHFKSVLVSGARVDNVCLNHGPTYECHDNVVGRFLWERTIKPDMRKKCTFQLPEGPYQDLQSALTATGYTSNDAIAKRSHCPTAMDFQEFYSFSTLRAGHRLQIHNIARELVTMKLNFEREETYLLFVQALWQVGPSAKGTSSREVHTALREDRFGLDLITALRQFLSSHKGNWQNAIAVKTASAVCRRILSPAISDIVQRDCLSFLREVRTVTLSWIESMNQDLRAISNELAKQTRAFQILNVALICYETFDVVGGLKSTINKHRSPSQMEREPLSTNCVNHSLIQSLFASPCEVFAATTCMLYMHDLCPPNQDGLPIGTKRLLARCLRLRVDIEEELRTAIISCGDGLHKAIKQLWNGYHAAESWGINDNDNSWLFTSTSAADGRVAASVCFNVLSGALLVNGTPLARLPQEYEKTLTYRRLFGKMVMEVFPSTMADMRFQARGEINGYKIHFNVQENELILRIERPDHVLEVIPTTALEGDLPERFVSSYVHWFNLSTREIELRPLAEPWMGSSSHCKIQADGDRYSMVQAKLSLVDMHSPVAQAIYSLLKPLEALSFMHIFFDKEDGQLVIHLHRFNLDFRLAMTSRRLYSKQFRGMFVDEDQYLGAFTGLVSKLVLRDSHGSRMALVPYGEVHFRREGNHVRVSIDHSSHEQVVHHVYVVDAYLQRLRGNGGLRGKLFQAYLHALTSHCLVDDLTARTGTEESLELLRGAWTKSFLRFEDEDVRLLQCIARLTPEVKHYPSHLHVMQQIRWTNLPTLSQHCEFVELVKGVIDDALSLSVFRTDMTALERVKTASTRSLLQRMAAKQTAYRVDGFGANAHERDFDIAYASRDRMSHASRESAVVEIVKLVDSWSTDLRQGQDLHDIISSWPGAIGGAEMDVVGRFKFRFDTEWLQNSEALLPLHFGRLVAMSTSTNPNLDKIKIMFLLSTFAFTKGTPKSFYTTLLAFATVPQLRAMKIPPYPEFTLKDGYIPTENALRSIAQSEVRDIYDCPEQNLAEQTHETTTQYQQRQSKDYDTNCELKVDSFVSQLMSQWPTDRLSRPKSGDINTHIMLDRAFASAHLLFQSCFRNKELQCFIGKVQNILSGLSTCKLRTAAYCFALPPRSTRQPSSYMKLEDLIIDGPPKQLQNPVLDALKVAGQRSTSTTAASPVDVDHRLFSIKLIHETPRDRVDLHQLLADLSIKQDCSYEKTYIQDLSASLEAYDPQGKKVLGDADVSEKELRQHLHSCKANMSDIHSSLQKHFFENDRPCDTLAALVGLIPRLSTTALLGRLSSIRTAQVPSDWKAYLVYFGLALSTVQHADRLVRYCHSQTDLNAELQNRACAGWDPLTYPDWLLFELENNLRIRKVQAQIAEKMIDPQTRRGSVLQLNMGEGKSSVITPIVAAQLANRTRLLRVVVLKQLSAQMHRILSSSLGGMLNRPVLQMPFSRSIPLGSEQALSIMHSYEACMSAGGIVLLQPEHIASYELMMHDSYLSEKYELAHTLWSSHRWLHEHARDILDESDEILSTRFELVYTTGSQKPVDFAPHRWILTQRVLRVIATLAPGFATHHELGFILLAGYGGDFPQMRLVDEEIDQKDALELYLSSTKAEESALRSLGDMFDDDQLSKTLLVLRGLFAHGVLLFAFLRKRWRVDYGLSPSRTQLAVPYRAKDCPESRSEFSHPEVIIVLTCLSYYYGGLSNEQLRQCFEAITTLDDAEDVYAYWVRDAKELPVEYRTLAGVNWQDPIQRQHLHPCFRFAKAVIDFFVARHVFRHELREFPQKLAASSWNLAREKKQLITGFSGTCDSRYVLPLSIEQDNSPGQRYTNAAVLHCLLSPHNEVWPITNRRSTQSATADELLSQVISAERPIRVIIDVGAQILEWTNAQTAHQWLSRVPKAEVDAAVFFDDNDEIVVLDRSERIEILATSPYASNLERCVVYLDEVHTRGTDLKLPADFRAAVTLSTGLTKDRLVQACMRMRKLDRGQSLIILVSTEVRRRILQFLTPSSSGNDAINMSDVLKWCISQTWMQTKRDLQRWTCQGNRYAHQQTALSDDRPETWTSDQVEHYICEPDAKSLEKLYGHGLKEAPEALSAPPGKHMEQMALLKSLISDKRVRFGIEFLNTSMLEEEQERELSPELQQLRIVEPPPDMQPYTHYLHQSVRDFFQRGCLDLRSGAFLPAFALFQTTSARHNREKVWDKNLLLTKDFAATVRNPKKQNADLFLRPVHWVARMVRGGTTTLVIISPYEANELFSAQPQSSSVTLHVYSARTSEYITALDNLTFCTIERPTTTRDTCLPLPRLLQIQLNLFAGQTVLNDYEYYVHLCQFLGVLHSTPSNGIVASIDGYLKPSLRKLYDELMSKVCPFQQSPLSFLKQTTSMRRDGKTFDKSHVGRLLHGEILKRSVFE